MGSNRHQPDHIEEIRVRAASPGGHITQAQWDRAWLLDEVDRLTTTNEWLLERVTELERMLDAK